MSASISVTKLYPIRDEGSLIATLPTFDWAFGEYGPVWLYIGNEKIEVLYIGSGNQKGNAVVKLSLMHLPNGVIDRIEKLAIQSPNDIRIERKEP